MKIIIKIEIFLIIITVLTIIKISNGYTIFKFLY